MDHTWSRGLTARQQARGKAGSQTLPSIAPGGSSPHAVGAGAGRARPLGSAASDPALSRSEGFGGKKGASLRVAQFVQRQCEPTEGKEAKLKLSLTQREIADGTKARRDCAFLGARGKEGFCTYLRTKYGSLLAGWRVLDAHKNGRISFYELCNACRKIGYGGNLKQLWGQLDVNCNGSVSLYELDPEVGHYVGTFKLALMKKYGDMLAAWNQGLNTKGSSTINEEDVVECCQRLGLGLDGKKLYGMLRMSPTGSGVTLAELDPDAYRRMLSGDPLGLTARANTEFLDDMPGLGRDISMPQDVLEHPVKEGVKKLRKQTLDRELAEHKVERDKIIKMKVGLHTIPGFKRALIVRCGSLLAAWREALDLDGNDRITFGEFCIAMKNLGFHGDVRGLWKELDSKQTGQIKFVDFDPETDAALTELRGKLTAEYGNMLLAWMKLFDSSGAGCCLEPQFEQACKKLGFSGDAGRLFKQMLPGADRKHLTLKDFDTRAYHAFSRGDFRMISEQDPLASKRSTELSFHERQQTSTKYQLINAWETAKRDEFASACRMEIGDHVIDTREAFEDKCRRTYGSLIGAWRHCLDSDQNGKLTFNELCQALRKLGYSGDFKELWRKYDTDRNGHISLKELDPETDELVNSFLRLLTEKFGHLDNAWKLGFGKDPHECIDEAGLREACGALGYAGDAHKLFNCFQPMPGRQLITIWDLDPLCTRKKQQGREVLFVNEPKSAESRPGRRSKFGQEDSLMAASKSTHGGESLAATSRSTHAGDSVSEYFRQVLRKKYGSTFIAWRSAFDPFMQGGVSFGKFAIVLEDCDFYGNKKALWHELCPGRTSVTFQDVDPGLAAILEDFQRGLLSKFGCLVQAWQEGLDGQGFGRLGEDEFGGACRAHGVGAKGEKKLFSALVPRPEVRQLTCEDLRPLLMFVPPADRESTWARAEEEGAVERNGKAASQPTSPNASQPNAPKSPPSTPLPPRTLVSQARQEHHDQDKIMNSLQSFKSMLVTKYGSLFAGWRQGLDMDQNGVVTQNDFAKACQFLGVKAVQKLWSELDTNKDGHIALGELDPEVADPFASLEHALVEQHGSTQAGWQKIFDADGSHICDKSKFLAGCEKITFQGDAERFFKLLRPEPGRPFLTYEDLWKTKEPKLPRPAPGRSSLAPKAKAFPSSPFSPASPFSPVIEAEGAAEVSSDQAAQRKP